jgi:hypothetical protein
MIGQFYRHKSSRVVVEVVRENDGVMLGRVRAGQWRGPSHVRMTKLENWQRVKPLVAHADKTKEPRS